MHIILNHKKLMKSALIYKTVLKTKTIKCNKMIILINILIILVKNVYLWIK